VKIRKRSKNKGIIGRVSDRNRREGKVVSGKDE